MSLACFSFEGDRRSGATNGKLALSLGWVGSRSLWHLDLPQGFSQNFKFVLACCTKGWKGHVAPFYFFFFLVTFWSNCLTICNHGVCLPACFLCFATAEVGGSGVTAAFTALYCMAVPSISHQNSEIPCGRVLLLHYLCGRISWAFLQTFLHICSCSVAEYAEGSLCSAKCHLFVHG